MNISDTPDLPSLEAKLKATQKELAESILQRDLAIRLVRRQTLVNAQFHRQLMISSRLRMVNLSWSIHQILYHRLRRVALKPLKQFIKQHFLGMTRHHILLAWNVGVYVVALTVFGVAIWKSLVVGVLVFASTFIPYGFRTLLWFGVMLQMVLLAVWVHALPNPQEWPNALHNMLAWIRSPA